MKPEADPSQAAQDLFLEMLEALDPLAVLGRQPDADVRAEAERLWHHHLAADDEGFLAEPPTIVRDLHAPAPAGRTWQAGARLAARFVVLEFLGEGGMGEVYLAHDDRLHDRV